MLSQPGGRRPRGTSDVIPPMSISSKLLNLSEGSGHKKELSMDDDNHNEVRIDFHSSALQTLVQLLNRLKMIGMISRVLKE